MDDSQPPIQQNTSIPLTMPTQASVPTSAPVDLGALLDHASRQIEQIIEGTPSSPSQRAEQIQAVKAAYLKARYNLEIGYR